MAPLAVLEGHTSWVRCVAIGDVRGRAVLASGSWLTVIVWDLATNTQLTKLTHTDTVLAVTIRK